MNQEKLTTLLERLGSQVPVGPAPVEQVAGMGRHRQRVRRGIQLAGVASAVALIAVGGVALHDNIAHSTPAAAGGSPTGVKSSPAVTPTLPGRPPTVHELMGGWRRIVGPGLPPTTKQGLVHDTRGLTFLMLGGKPHWGGYDGCNWVGGDVNLGTDGSFSTSNVSSTTIGCLDPLPPSSVDVVQRAAQIRLADGRLAFYDKADKLLGTFVRVSAGH